MLLSFQRSSDDAITIKFSPTPIGKCMKLLLHIVLVITVMGSPAAGNESPPSKIFREGTTNTILFHSTWPAESSSESLPYYTIRFASFRRPFIINGLVDPDGLKTQNQRVRFMVSNFVRNNSLTVNFTTHGAQKEDADNYIYKFILYGHGDEESAGKSEIVHIDVQGDAKCYFIPNRYITFLSEAHCMALVGDSNSSLACFQAGHKSEPKEGMKKHGKYIKATFWVEKNKQTFCCSHLAEQNITQDSCTEFVWPNESSTPSLNLEPTNSEEREITSVTNYSCSARIQLSYELCALVLIIGCLFAL